MLRNNADARPMLIFRAWATYRLLVRIYSCLKLTDNTDIKLVRKFPFKGLEENKHKIIIRTTFTRENKTRFT